MDTERRQFPRATPHEPVYVSFANQNHGIVVDACEDGLQFRADAPVQHDEDTVPVRFTFSPFGEMETVGEIMWMDAENRTGGLRIKNLPVRDRSNIRRWLERNALPLPPRAGAASAQSDSAEAEAVHAIESERVVAAENEPAGATIAASERRDTSPVWASAPTSEFAEPWRPPVGARLYQTEVLRHRVRNVVITVLGLVFVVIAGLGMFFYWRTAGGRQSLGQVLSELRLTVSKPGTQSTTVASEISPLLRPPSKIHRIRSSVVRDGELRSSSSPGSADLAMALQYLGGDVGQDETKVAVKWLWAGVKKGNTKAAMLLANLYAWGHGVPQNCEQARVLLIAASNRGSTEAALQLQDMEADGCGTVTASSK